MESIEDKICTILKSLVKNDSVITSESVVSSLGLNSLDFINFVVMIETEYDIEFEDNFLSQEKFETVYDVIKYVEIKINQS